jgi:hypothetical protein
LVSSSELKKELSNLELKKELSIIELKKELSILESIVDVWDSKVFRLSLKYMNGPKNILEEITGEGWKIQDMLLEEEQIYVEIKVSSSVSNEQIAEIAKKYNGTAELKLRIGDIDRKEWVYGKETDKMQPSCESAGERMTINGCCEKYEERIGFINVELCGYGTKWDKVLRQCVLDKNQMM